MSGFQSNYGGRGRGRGSSRGFGGGGRGRGRGPQQLQSAGGESFGLNLCRFYVKNSCNRGDTCNHDHAVCMLAQVDVAPPRTAVNCVAQWQETNVITATDEGCIKLWSTTDGATWTQSARQELAPRLPVTSLLVVSGFVVCGYEGPYALANVPQTPGGVPGGGGGRGGGALGSLGGGGGGAGGDDGGAVTVGMIRMLNLMGGEPASVEVVMDAKSTPYAHTHRVNCLAVGADAAGGMLLFSGGEEGTVRVWKAQGHGFVLGGTLEGHVRGVTALARAGNLLWSSSRDATVRVWDISTMACVGVIGAAGGLGHKGAVTCMTGPISVPVEGEPPGEYIVTGSTDRTICVWNAGTGDKMHETPPAHCRVTALAHYASSPSGALLLIGMEDGTIGVRDFPFFSLAFELNASLFGVGHRAAVRTLTPMTIAGPNQFFMSGGDDGRMMMWQLSLKPPTQ